MWIVILLFYVNIQSEFSSGIVLFVLYIVRKKKLVKNIIRRKRRED